jgi:hypothetical protein
VGRCVGAEELGFLITLRSGNQLQGVEMKISQATTKALAGSFSSGLIVATIL